MKNTGLTNNTSHPIDIITEYPERVATFRINDAYEFGYGLLSEGGYLIRAQSDSLERMELEAKRFAHGLAVDRGWTHSRDNGTDDGYTIGVDAA